MARVALFDLIETTRIFGNSQLKYRWWRRGPAFSPGMQPISGGKAHLTVDHVRHVQIEHYPFDNDYFLMNHQDHEFFG
ncbi:MAG: hypothetical protein R6V38_08625 [Roseovarius gahaiensis]